MRDDPPTSPTDVTDETTWFDRAADHTSHAVAKPPFFVASLGIVVAWVFWGFVSDFSHRWVDALVILVSLVTFLMVALLQNEGWRNAKATQRKLNAMSAALAELMAKTDVDDEHVDQLDAAVGVEKRESTTRH